MQHLTRPTRNTIVNGGHGEIRGTKPSRTYLDPVGQNHVELREMRLGRVACAPLACRASGNVKEMAHACGSASPRMPHTLGEIFHACAITRFQKPQHLGYVDRQVTCAVSRARSQRLALLQASAETTASGSSGKEDLKADRRVRHYKEVGLQEWPLAGRATVAGVLLGIGLYMSVRRRTILSKSLWAPAPVELTIHTFRTVDRTAGRCFAVVARFGKR